MGMRVGEQGARKDIALIQGVDFSIELTITNASGTALNITGYTFSGEIRDKPGGAILETFAFAITDAPNGKVKWSLTDTETGLMSVGGWYDVKMTDAASEVKRLLWGHASLIKEVTA